MLKKINFLKSISLIFFLIAFINLPFIAYAAKNSGDENKKIEICHIPPGNPANAHEITISENALKAHLVHGDYVGKCKTVVPPVCGNGLLQDGEQCDDGNLLNNDGCSSACKLEVCGDNVKQTNEQCDDGNVLNDDGCSATCNLEVCGDNIKQADEQCDDGNLLNDDGCSSTCNLEICSDGIQQTNEECDDSNLLNDDGCSSVCKLEVCGDNIKQSNEQCDDGNLLNDDGCSSLCKLEVCGDNIKQASEQCDDGNLLNDDGCSSTCTLEVCGDNVKQINEECDDGNLLNNDGCSASCNIEVCGDNVKQANEQCDDGNVLNNDDCSSACNLEICSDGIQQTNEECDDGNLLNDDGCSSVCKLEVCGDNVKQTNEECDDGNLLNNDGCSATCNLEVCGDNVQQTNEQCDDGNILDNDGCSSTCSLEVCGDGVTQANEQCDDGNAVSGDGCDSTCKIEEPVNEIFARGELTAITQKGVQKGEADLYFGTNTYGKIILNCTAWNECILQLVRSAGIAPYDFSATFDTGILSAEVCDGGGVCTANSTFIVPASPFPSEPEALSMMFSFTDTTGTNVGDAVVSFTSESDIIYVTGTIGVVNETGGNMLTMGEAQASGESNAKTTDFASAKDGGLIASSMSSAMAYDHSSAENNVQAVASGTDAVAASNDAVNADNTATVNHSVQSNGTGANAFASCMITSLSRGNSTATLDALSQDGLLTADSVNHLETLIDPTATVTVTADCGDVQF